MSNSLRLDPARLAAWRAARHIEGIGGSASTKTPALATADVPAAAASLNAMDKAS